MSNFDRIVPFLSQMQGNDPMFQKLNKLNENDGNKEIINDLSFPEPFKSIVSDATEEDIIEAIKWNFKAAYEVKRPFEIKMDLTRAYFENNIAFEDKDIWQSKIKFPVVRKTVTKLVARLSRILTLARNDWFSVESNNAALKPYYDIIKDMLKQALNSEKLDIFDVFQKCLIAGMTTGLMGVLVTWTNQDIQSFGDVLNMVKKEDYSYMDLPWGSESNEIDMMVTNENHLSAFVESPKNILLDPTKRNRFNIRYYPYSKGEFRAEAKEREWENVEEVLSTYKDDQDMRQYYEQFWGNTGTSGHLSAAFISSLKHNKVVITEFYGDLYDEEGELLGKNIYAVLANMKYLLQFEINPFAHKRSPLVTCNLLDDPFAVYSESFVSMNLEVFDAWIKITNMMLDFFGYSVNPVFEVYQGHIENSTEDFTKIHPGKIIYKDTLEPVIHTVPPPDLPQSFWVFYQQLMMERDEGAGLIDSESPGAFPRRQMTAAEFTHRDAKPGDMFDYIFRNIEKQFLVPILRQSFFNILQFTPQPVWEAFLQNKIADIIDREIKQNKQTGKPIDQMAIEQQSKENEMIILYNDLIKLTPEQRVRLFGNSIYFKTEIFSAVFDRQTMVEKLTYIISTIPKIPVAQASIQWNNLLSIMVKALGVDEQSVIYTKEEALNVLKEMERYGMVGYLQEGSTPGVVPENTLPAGIPQENALMGQGINEGASASGAPKGFNIPMGMP